MSLDDYIDDPVEPTTPVEESIEEIEVQEESEIILPIAEDDTNDEESSPESVAYFEALKQYGVLDLPEDFEFKGEDSLEEALHLTKKNLHSKTVASIWEALPPDFKPLLEYALQGGTSLQAYLDAYAPKDFELDLDDPISQKQIIKEYYRQTNPRLTEEKLDQMVSRREAAGALKEEAQDALEFLEQLEEERKASLVTQQAEERARAEQEAKAKEEALKASIDSFNVDTTRKNRLKSFLFTPIKEGESTTTQFNKALSDILQHENHLVQLVDILADYDVRTGFSFDRLIKRIKTDTTKTFKELVTSKLDSKSSVRGTPAKNVKDDIDWDAYFGKK